MTTLDERAILQKIVTQDDEGGPSERKRSPTRNGSENQQARLVNGIRAAAAGATLFWQWVAAQELAPERSADASPQHLSGMRGDHPGSFEAAHQLRDSPKVDSSSVAHTNETYDLVIVGGGISGLGAAYYFLMNSGRSARVLILDTYDDFGGHAKRMSGITDCF